MTAVLESESPAVEVAPFLPFLVRVADREAVDAALRGPVTAVAEPGAVERVLHAVWSDLVAAVERQSLRTLIGAFHAFRAGRGLPMSRGSDAALRAFDRHLGDPAVCAALLAAHPVLDTRLRTLVAHSLAGCAEVFTAYAADRDALVAAGVAGGGAVSGIALTGSDLHNGGRQVVVLELAGGERLLHKPRSLHTDRFTAELFAAADPHLAHSLRGCVPASLTVGEHGWQRFVTAGPMDDPAQAARYFYRFGALCAVLGAVGASDLHDENVLACGEYPCVIDTETVLRADAGVEVDSLPHSLITHMKLSAAATMLVPVVNPTSPIDVLMAGVGVAQDQRSSLTRVVVRDAGTDAVALAFEPITYRHGENLPRIGDRALSATGWFGDLQAGCLDGLAFVRSGAAVAALEGWADMPVRSLLRSTLVYGRFVDASTHPDYLTSEDEADRLLGLLGQFPDHLSREAARGVAAAERAALAVGDVPYFTTGAGSTDLVARGARVPGAYRTTPLDFARRGLGLAAERSDAYHLFHLEECFGEVAGPDPAGLSAHGVFRPALDGAGPGTWWPAVARTLADVAVSFAGPGGVELGWLAGIGPGRGASTVTPGNHIAFHDGGGLAAFLLAAGRRDPGLRAAGEAADRGLTTLLAEYGGGLDATPESMFSGSASLLLTRPDAADGPWLDRLLDAVDARVAAGEAAHDLANGPAGVLAAVLACREAGADLGGASRPERLLDVLRDHLARDRSAHWFDVAHGELGLRWAQARAGRVLGEPRLAAQAADWLAGRFPDGADIPVTGWCNGVAGLLLAGAEIAVSAGRADWFAGPRLAGLVDRATRLPASRPVDLSVCHGSSGVVQALLAASRLLDDPSLVTRAAEYQQRVLDAARAHGWSTGTAGRTSLVGYMLGWAGVGDTDARLGAALAGDPPASLPVALWPREPRKEGAR